MIFKFRKFTDKKSSSWNIIDADLINNNLGAEDKQINFNVDGAEFRRLQQLVNKDQDLNNEEMTGKVDGISLL